MGFTFAGRWGVLIQFTILFLFAGLGIGILAEGIVLKLNSDTIENENVRKMLDQIDFNGRLKLGSVIAALSYTFLYKGASCVIWALLGGCAAYSKNRCAMVTMAMIVLLVVMQQIVFLGLWAGLRDKMAMIVLLVVMQQIVFLGLWAGLRDKVNGEMKTELEATLVKYDGPISLLDVSIGWDVLMLGYDCCGVNDVSSANLEFENTTWWFNVSRGEKEIPFTCCRIATEANYKTGFDPSCTDGHYIAVNYNGCYEIIKDWLQLFLNPAIILGSFLIIVEIMFIVFSFIICQSIARSEVIV